ncbi:hypothetical protein [Roseitalea porphyridii]|uniref:Uncharacterized protein n=1 Tax=Roseitalea porphyridii TaxID=1852022 RepID=A0A4P6V0C8_9HYPH|nr:hypothetical protein [Roseitalea porphyridii]QBK30782.1 hypothetical protein E0E05_09360 [Roseitalea porphyridii]
MILGVLRKHFPDAEIDDIEALMVEHFLESTDRLSVADPERQKRLVRQFESGLRSALAAINDMHPNVGLALWKQFGANTDQRLADGKLGWPIAHDTFDGRKGPTSPSALLEAMLWSLTGRSTDRIATDDPVYPSAVKAATDEAAKLRAPSGKATESKTWEKITFYEGARIAWERYSGNALERHTKDFVAFLTDLANAKGVDWDAQDIINSARRREALKLS